MIDIIIPTIPGREASLARCVAAYEQNTTIPHKIHVLTGYPTCGQAWRAGVEQTTGNLLHLTADDLEPHVEWDWAAINILADGQIPCPVVYEPDGAVQSTHGVSYQQGISTEPKQHTEPVGFTTVPTLRREWWPHIGMPDLHYCSDAWVSVKARQIGIETVACPSMRFTHHNDPVGRGAAAGEQHTQTANDRALFTRLMEDAA